MTEKKYTVPIYNRIIRATLRPIFRGLFHILSRVSIIGRENIPKKEAYLIAINHVSLFEPPFVLAFWPVAPEAAGAVDIWSRPFQSLLARLYGGIQIHRGEYDRQIIDTMLSVLNSGRSLLIAPEGGRSHALGMRRALPGVAYLIDRAKVPVIPVGIVGATDDFLSKALRGKRSNIEMRIGKPMHLPPIEGQGRARRLSRLSIADQIMHQIAVLLPPEYHGVYKDETTREHSQETGCGNSTT